MNEQTEIPQKQENIETPPVHSTLEPAAAQPEVRPNVNDAIEAQGCGGGCSTVDGNGHASVPEFVYAVGRIEARFPSLSAEKEFAQAAGRDKTAGKTDQEVFQSVLSRPENRYLLRHLCWVFTIQGIETYLLVPRDPADVGLLLEAIRSAPGPADIDVVIGVRGPIAPPEMCNGLMIPIIFFDQIYSFDRGTLMKALPKPAKANAAKFNAAAEEVFDRVMHITDNAGATDEHRALNYLAMRYPGIYEKAANMFASDFSMSGVEVRSASTSGTRNMVDVIFSFTNRKTDFTEKASARVDVGEEFPFLVTTIGPYYDR